MPKHLSNVKKGAEAAVGLAALAAAAAGAYYFYGSKNAAKHRKQMKSWTVKAKAEVMEKMEQMNNLSQGAYEKAVAEVTNKYKHFKNVPPKELQNLSKELKSHWKSIAAHLSKSPVVKKPTAKKRR